MKQVPPPSAQLVHHIMARLKPAHPKMAVHCLGVSKEKADGSANITGNSNVNRIGRGRRRLLRRGGYRAHRRWGHYRKSGLLPQNLSLRLFFVGIYSNFTVEDSYCNKMYRGWNTIAILRQLSSIARGNHSVALGLGLTTKKNMIFCLSCVLRQ
jgi:hypothetical protein